MHDVVAFVQAGDELILEQRQYAQAQRNGEQGDADDHLVLVFDASQQVDIPLFDDTDQR